MKKALINPNQMATYIVSWELIDGRYTPVYDQYPNSMTVCDVEQAEFPVAEPMFWVDCQDDVVSYEYYYDSSDQTIKPVVNAPYPINPKENQPVVTGLQDL